MMLTPEQATERAAAELERVQKLLAELQSSADQEEWHFHNGVCEEEYHADLRLYAEALGEIERLRDAISSHLDSNWCNYGNPDSEFIAVRTPVTGRRNIHPSWVALRAALAPAPEAQA